MVGRGGAALWLVLASSACGRSDVRAAGAEGSAGASGIDGDDDDDDDDEPYMPAPQQCREVDFLFVIDNSISMLPYQENLAANYAGFIDGIQEAIDTIETVHIGVVATEPYPANPTGCDGLGALVTRTGGLGSSDRSCGPYREGGNYMTPRDDLESKFPCAAQVGVGGSDHDAPLGAALSAISSPLVDPGACNEGFIGDGALLVLVILSESYPSATELPGDIDPYFAGVAIAETMGGFDDVVVVLLASTEATPCLSPLSPALGDFARLFDHYYEGAICESDYRRVFDPAIDVVKAACPTGY
ncbi:MAG: hypothetical protein IPH07_29530 [Deltaproteobacteria bacterium]|nr:hypothetical protein [Deltaproteobacteria bacterium]MBK8715054.1 hypothetical protein [Deltaproteobacteria bacterium]MBP7287070.1 hypothetical protein [Nannocystaceae bacterium]